MNRATSLFMTIIALTAAGCASSVKDINRAPEFSPVGANIGSPGGLSDPAFYPIQPEAPKYSLWNKRQAQFFRDPRAAQPGDVLTVIISIDEKAELDNKSGRSRVSSQVYGAAADFESSSGSGGGIAGNLDLGSNTRSNGQGVIERSEKIELAVAAIVTNALPNGNMVISGSQEIRVNNEMRVLNVTGVVRPRDISGYNTISYEKIAEARISYGGRGRVSEVQQPPYGQQFLDMVAPF
ncbi:MAG: flagellar basal body L-ring protein FlgH [Phyllobacterium sp.]